MVAYFTDAFMRHLASIETSLVAWHLRSHLQSSCDIIINCNCSCWCGEMVFTDCLWLVASLCRHTELAMLCPQSDRRHYDDVIMGAIESQITSLTIVYSTFYSDADQRRHQSSASLAFVLVIHRGPVNSPHKWPVTRKIFPFDDVIIRYG